MRIIEIKALDNGAHRNQTCDEMITPPEGFAVVPDDMELDNFPFGEVTAEEIDGVMTVTKWVAGTIPSASETVSEPTAMEQLRADIDYIAILSGVEL